MIEVDKQETSIFGKIISGIVRLLCLLLPIGFAFAGYFLAPSIWNLFNKETEITECFHFVCAIIFFIVPVVIIFISTRKLNPMIKITLKK